MNKTVLGSIIGFMVGALMVILILFKASPGMMLNEMESKYGFEESVTRLEQAATDAGWKVPAVHDLQASMKSFGKDVRSVKVFALCKPEHAYKILEGDSERLVSVLMPCRVAVYEKSDGSVYLSMMNAKPLAKAMGGIVKEVMVVAMEENIAFMAPLLAE